MTLPSVPEPVEGRMTDDASTSSATVFTVDECWAGEWLGSSVVVADARGFRLATDADPAPSGHLAGTLLPGFRDAHVHLGLVDGSALPAAGIAAVDDFGWDLETARGWADAADLPSVRYAGQLLTAPGGYPSGSGWAPTGAVATVTSVGDAAQAVDRQLDAGASFIKVALNSDAGPVFDDATLHAIVGHAHARGVIVAAHAQGAGQAARAFEAGVDRLAHAPWSEELGDDLLAAMARSQSWVSTLDIHGWGRYGRDFEVAQRNVRRFVALGGTVLYGTDLGNGTLPLGINARELRELADAGLGPDALVDSIASMPAAAGFGPRASYIAEPRTPDTAAWLATASVLSIESLEGLLS
ncbi:amidohydrolase family protein [Parafrigoribacterium soli]|uniref:amidohydrolase family protein n=1 Tax=Parafrigoribacterium soli TaxID=3144663 RepID=UPI0032F04781